MTSAPEATRRASAAARASMVSCSARDHIVVLQIAILRGRVRGEGTKSSSTRWTARVRSCRSAMERAKNPIVSFEGENDLIPSWQTLPNVGLKE